jgi:hypothetical protein
MNYDATEYKITYDLFIQPSLISYIAAKNNLHLCRKFAFHNIFQFADDERGQHKLMRYEDAVYHGVHAWIWK